MGKKSKTPKVEVTDYFLSQHYGICLAEPDAIKDILVDEKSVLTTPITSNSIVSVDLPELFGGVTKEGGLQGNIQALMGADDQFLPDELAQKLGRPNGASAPGYRGLASLFFYGSTLSRGFKWKSNAPFIPGVWAKVQRILKRANGDDQWYPEAAVINTCSNTTDEAIIRLEIGGVVDGFPNLGYFISGLGDGFNGSSQRIPVSEIETTTQNDFNVQYRDPETGFWVRDFYWRGPFVPLAGEFNLRMQWNSGFTGEPAGFRVSMKNSGNAGFTTLFTKPGSDSQTQGNGFANFPGGLFPRDWQFDAIEGGSNLDNLDMNPAHIIHECLTDREWGMGTPLASLDDVAFRAAADTLVSEKFGLSMIFTRQGEIETFINEVLDHIQGVLYTDPRTGLLVLDLIRGDYDASTLPIITPDTADLSNFSRKLWGEIVNEIVVTWTNPVNEQDETITAQDNASIAVQGGIVSDGRNYYGVRCSTLAQELAYRDLRSAGQPLASCEAVVDRTQYDLRPGSVIKLTWPEYGLTELVMRVQSVDYGKPGDPTIKLSLIEDVYGLDIGSFDTPPSTAWVDPSAAPTAVDPERILTLPYFVAVNTDVASFISDTSYPEVLAGILGTSDNTDGWEFDVLDEVTQADGSTAETVITTMNLVGSATLTAALSREASSAAITVDNFTGNTGATQAGFMLIDGGSEAADEIAMITSIAGGALDLARGVMDTVPREWPAGSRVYFFDDATVFEDPEIRSSGEVVDYKLLMRTSQGRFDAATAPLVSETLTDRPWLPTRPANAQVNGQSFSRELAPIDETQTTGDIPLTWSLRNRIEEDSQILRWTDAGVTPESAQTTTIELRDLTGTLLQTYDAAAASSFNLPRADFGANDVAEVRFFSERSDSDGDFVSLQYWSEWIRISGTARRTEANDERLTEANETRLTEE